MQFDRGKSNSIFSKLSIFDMRSKFHFTAAGDNRS